MSEPLELDRTLVDSQFPEPTRAIVPADLHVTPLGASGDYAVLSFSTSPLTLPKSLSRAERDVAVAIAVGSSNATIAKARGTSVRTVENQIYGIFRKLGVGSRCELAAYLGGQATAMTRAARYGDGQDERHAGTVTELSRRRLQVKRDGGL